METEPLQSRGFFVESAKIRNLMHQVGQSPIADIIVQGFAGFREDLLHSGGIWMDGKTIPLCLQWQRQILRQNTTRKNQRGIPGHPELPLLIV